LKLQKKILKKLVDKKHFDEVIAKEKHIGSKS